jgi:hypothetical protein
MNEDFATWDAETLHARVDLVWDFDQACEAAVSAFIEFAKTHLVQETEVLVPTRKKIAVPA